MKSLFVILFCLFAAKGFSQTADVMVEEKSSEWIKVTTSAAISKPRTTTARKSTGSRKPATSKRNTQEEFEKTNQQVNRFKKGKKD